MARAVESLRREALAAVHALVGLRSRRSEFLALLGLIVAGVLLGLLLALLCGGRPPTCDPPTSPDKSHHDKPANESSTVACIVRPQVGQEQDVSVRWNP